MLLSGVEELSKRAKQYAEKRLFETRGQDEYIATLKKNGLRKLKVAHTKTFMSGLNRHKTMGKGTNAIHMKAADVNELTEMWNDELNKVTPDQL